MKLGDYVETGSNMGAFETHRFTPPKPCEARPKCFFPPSVGVKRAGQGLTTGQKPKWPPGMAQKASSSQGQGGVVMIQVHFPGHATGTDGPRTQKCLLPCAFQDAAKWNPAILPTITEVDSMAIKQEEMSTLHGVVCPLQNRLPRDSRKATSTNTP